MKTLIKCSAIQNLFRLPLFGVCDQSVYQETPLNLAHALVHACYLDEKRDSNLN